MKGSFEIFNAVSAPTRIQILRQLAIKGPLTYSEIMGMLNFEPTKDAGKFVYHLRNLIDVGVVEFEKAIRKYKITELGLMLVNFSQDLEEYSLKKSGRMLVRTSKYTIEEFDRSKITSSLVEEAGVSASLAEKISSETEERLLKLSLKYLTAPLIREFVNAILIENGLEDYRHKLTRLGMPVHDVKKTLEEASQKSLSVEFVRSMTGNRVMTEYMLLNILPRDVADTHLSGQIHISDSSSWAIVPSTVYHDLRIFLGEGLKNQRVNLNAPILTPPKNFADALMLTDCVVNTFRSEVSGEQALDYFNVFLAPFLHGKPTEDTKKLLKNFLVKLSPINLGSFEGVTLGVEVTVPPHLKDMVITGPEGMKTGIYEDYDDKAREVLEMLLDTMLDLSVKKPLFNPQLVLKFRAECLTGKYDEILEKAHRLASKYGTLYVANLTKEPNAVSSYMATGEKVDAEWSGDWEADTLRVGFLNRTAINLPRIAYESKNDDEKFFKVLEGVLEIVVKALEIKKREMIERINQKLLPNLSGQMNGESYFRLNSSPGVISIVGLNEAVKFHLGYEVHEDLMPQHFAIKILEQLKAKTASISEKSGLRFILSQVSDVEASQRLAGYDVERYGWSIVYPQDRKEHPYYTFIGPVPDELELPLDEKLKLEEKFHPIFNGGHFTQLWLKKESSSEGLLKQTKDICENYHIGFFAYSYTLTYCDGCQKTFQGYKQKCPLCGKTRVTVYARQSTRYLPLEWWTHKGRLSIIKRS